MDLEKKGGATYLGIHLKSRLITSNFLINKSLILINIVYRKPEKLEADINTL